MPGGVLSRLCDGDGVEEKGSPRHRRRERRRERATPGAEAAAPPVHAAELTPTTDQGTAGAAPATDLGTAGAAPATALGTAGPATDLGTPRATPVTDQGTTGPAPATDLGTAGPAADLGTARATPATDQGTAGPAPVRRKPRTRRTDAERSLRGIVGAGSSQVGVVGAMRARDAARPTAEDLAAAERDLVIARRHYVPPGALPGAR